MKKRNKMKKNYELERFWILRGVQSASIKIGSKRATVRFDATGAGGARHLEWIHV
jgi:hypothetical protein